MEMCLKPWWLSFENFRTLTGLEVKMAKYDSNMIQTWPCHGPWIRYTLTYAYDQMDSVFTISELQPIWK